MKKLYSSIEYSHVHIFIAQVIEFIYFGSFSTSVHSGLPFRNTIGFRMASDIIVICWSEYCVLTFKNWLTCFQFMHKHHHTSGWLRIMQLYHHPYSLDSQKVRLALEERGVDYTSHRVNPITGKNMDSFFFRMNPSANLPVFQNGSHIIFDTIEIIKYVLYFLSY